jgi:hypothetical protein
MPGGFTHFALVRTLGINKTLMSIEGMTQEIALDLQDAYPYLELGAVSPDLPYLAPFSENSEEWGNTLHHDRTVETIRAGVLLLPTLELGSKEHKRALAWLFGYASHVVADMISHPVVTNKIGPYETHKSQHRVCELNQDTYIFQTYFQDSVAKCEYLECGVKVCTEDERPGGKLAPFLNDFWRSVLKDVYPEKKMPEPSAWFRRFVVLIDKFADAGHHFVSVIRGYMEKEGYIYPDAPDMTYVKDLRSPYGRQISFDTLFERFQVETKKVWGQMSQAITLNNVQLITLPDGDLDTGINLADKKTSVFWNHERDLA